MPSLAGSGPNRLRAAPDVAGEPRRPAAGAGRRWRPPIAPSTRGCCDDRAARIAIIGSARYAIRRTVRRGLEAHTWALARALRQRGHEVTVFAGPGSDPAPRRARDRRPAAADQRGGARRREHDGDELARGAPRLPQLMLELCRARRQFDVVHNNCLHHLPIAMAPAVPTPMVTTLHTPPTPWLESAIQAGEPARSRSSPSASTPPRLAAPVLRRAGDQERRRPGRVAARARVAARRSGSGGWCPRRGRTSRSRPPARPAWRSTWRARSRTAATSTTDIRRTRGPGIRYLGHLDHAELAAGWGPPASRS